jgi:hypothetical protein
MSMIEKEAKDREEEGDAGEDKRDPGSQLPW